MTTQMRLPDPKQAKEYFENKLSFTCGPAELKEMMDEKENVTIIDVRDEGSYAEGHVPGAINLPKEKWATFEGLQKEGLNVVYCYNIVCHLAATAATTFAGAGYPVKEMEGGFSFWKEFDYEVETGSRPKFEKMSA